ATLATMHNPTATFALGTVGVMLFPLVARAFGLIASIVGIVLVRTSETEDPMKALNRGYYVASFLGIVGFVAATRWLLNTPSAPQPVVAFLLGRLHRAPDGTGLRLHPAVPPGIPLPAGKGDRRSVAAGARHEHHHGDLGRPGVHGSADDLHLRRDPALLFPRK